MKYQFLPLFSLSGITIISFGGLLLLKNKTDNIIISPSSDISSPNLNISPTQVPKSIEHYLLASQQFFTRALESQDQKLSPDTVTSFLNRSLAFASEAVRLFPSDYRSYLHRAQILQSLSIDQNQFLNYAIADLSQASILNPSSAEITRSLATLYARQGNPTETLIYLAKTVSLEPTKAQNFYDLAQIQKQTGQLTDAINTYDQLLTILTDANQKDTIIQEQTALKSLTSQNPSVLTPPTTSISPPPPLTDPNLPLLKADNSSGLIIAATDSNKNISVTNLTETNALSDNAILASGQKQIKITNSNLTPSSQVYVSIISGGKNQSLEVLSKSTDSFTVGLLSPITEDITFKWWIVN